MKVYIPFCGIGLGHAWRCLAIADKLMKEGHEVLLSTHEPTFSKIKKLGYDIEKTEQEAKMINTNNEFDPQKSVIETGKNIKNILSGLKTQNRIIKRFDPDIILNDNYFSAAFVSIIRGKKYVYITNQTTQYQNVSGKLSNAINIMMRNIVKFSHLTVVPDFPKPYTICRDNINEFGMKEKFKYVGPVLPKYPNSKKRIENMVLVYIAFKDIARKISRFAQEIKGIKFLFVGADNDYRIGNVEFRKFANNYYEMLEKSVALITHGGHTTIMGAAVFGKPIIGISEKTFSERENNLRGVEKVGLGFRLYPSKINEKIFEESIEKILSRPYQKNAEKFSCLAKKYNGTKKIVEIVENYPLAAS